MPADAPSHPDRCAATLANLPQAHADRSPDGCRTAGAGAADCRIELKLLQWQAMRAAERSPTAAEHLARLDRDRHPDLWQGTVRDGSALGMLAHLHEVVALAPPPTPPAKADEANELAPAQTFDAKQLRRKKDLLVKSGSTRVRFSRKGGVLLVDREHETHSENCMWFEARRDLGTLDEFVGPEGERARLFSAQFLKPKFYRIEKFRSGDAKRVREESELLISGRLGSGPAAWPISMRFLGDTSRSAVELQIELPHVPTGWRLRLRTLGVPSSLLHHHCLPVREQVDTERGGLLCDTLVRSCDRLRIDDNIIKVPDAGNPRPLRHIFTLGEAPRPSE
ncbi:MAG: hypothetical protein AB8H80_02195 [Planctomycetota bacterium]